MKAYADYIKEFHDREGMGVADRETQVIEAPERAVKAAAARARVKEEEDEKRKTERAIRKKEEVYPDRIPWTAVKRRSLEYDESREKPGQYYASMHLLNGHRDPIIRFASAAEVAEHYNGIFNDETDLAGYWPLNEGASSLARDASVNLNHGTLSGNAAFVGAASAAQGPKDSNYADGSKLAGGARDTSVYA